MGEIPNEELMDSMHELFSQSAYSDLIILCGNEKFHVHKAIVCPRANFFAATIDLDDAKTVVIQLPQEDLLYVKLIVYYLYHLDYPQGSLEEDNGDHDLATTHPDETVLRIDSPNLTTHVKVYSLAEKFGIRGLKALALDKFTAEAAEHWDSPDFSQAALEAYTSTVESDRALRDVVVKTLYRNPERVFKEDIRRVARELPLAYDLVEYILSEGHWGARKLT